MPLELSIVQIHNSPIDIAAWPITVNIKELTLDPKSGLMFDAVIPLSWDYHMPGWGDPAKGDDGNILYTVWALIKLGDQWHGSGIIQMWKRRPSTGAPILAEWHNWAYDRTRWGVMVDYRPQVGDQIGFLLSAGSARNERGVTSVRERSNVITISLPVNDTGTFRFKEAAEPAIPSSDVERILTAQEKNTQRILDAINKLQKG